jgi:MoaA/NifB/PqqE/SkfB family radical SAM enzyme
MKAPRPMFYAGNLLAAWRLFRRRPQLLSVALVNLAHRLEDRAVRGVSQVLHSPEQLTMVVTDLCNLRCRMCQYAFSDDPANQLSRVGKMTMQVFRKTIDEVAGRPLVSFTGGEPLLHPQVPEFIAYAKSRRRFCTLTTNGWMLAEQAESLARAGLDLLVVSVDGPQAIHDQVRGPRSFDRLSRGIDAVLRQPGRPLVFVSTAITDLNYRHLLETYDLARAWGVDGMNLNHLWMQTDEAVGAHNVEFSALFKADRVGWGLLPSRIDVTAVADQIEAIRRRNTRGEHLVLETPPLARAEMTTWYGQPTQPVMWTTTRCAWIRMKVSPDGKVKPCRGWEAGDLAREHAMRIWNGPRFRELRRTLAAHGTLPICARCCAIAHR